MERCLSYDSQQRPTFGEIRITLQQYVDEDYYLRLDDAYHSFNQLLEAEAEAKRQEEHMSENMGASPRSST